MNSKKLRVAYYDSVDSWNSREMREVEFLANWLIHRIEKCDEGKVVMAMVDVLLKDIHHPYNMFVYGVFNKKFGEIDKVIFSTFEKFGIERVKELYKRLNELGISLEFIKEEPVDEKFIEAYDFVSKRKWMWSMKKFEFIGQVPDRKIILSNESDRPDVAARRSLYKTVE